MRFCCHGVVRFLLHRAFCGDLTGKPRVLSDNYIFPWGKVVDASQAGAAHGELLAEDGDEVVGERCVLG